MNAVAPVSLHGKQSCWAMSSLSRARRVVSGSGESRAATGGMTGAPIVYVVVVEVVEVELKYWVVVDSWQWKTDGAVVVGRILKATRA